MHERTGEPLPENYEAELARICSTYPPDEDGNVRLETISAYELNSTAQYTYRFLTEGHDVPNLGDGLRVTGDFERFTDLRIQVEDVPILLDRIKTYKRERIAKILGQ